MTAQPTLDYARLMNATWALLNTGQDRRQALLDSLPAPERRLVASAVTPLLDVELARRRKSVSTVLLGSFPVTYFAYVAREGADGVMRFLGSGAWTDRPTQPGSSFPPAASTSFAFRLFVEASGWLDRQETWIQEAYAFERAFLFGADAPQPRQVDGRTARLVPGAWVAEASFDVPAHGVLLRDRGRDDPWHDVLFFAKARACPHAVVSVPDDGRIRRIRLSGPPASALRWLWDASAPAPADALHTPAFQRAVAGKLVEIE